MSGATPYTIDFDNTVSGINNGTLNAIIPEFNPLVGKMDIAGSQFTGSTFIGQSNGATSAGGWYSFLVSTGSRGLGAQPNSSFDYHDVSLKYVNYTSLIISSLSITFKLYAGDPQSRNSTITYAGSSGTGNTGTETTDNILSSGTATIGSWKYLTKTLTITGLSIPNTGTYTLKFSTDRGSGSGNSDEWALDDVQIIATTDICTSVTSPLSNASSISFGNTDCDRMTLNWSAGAGSNSLIAVSTLPIASSPVNGIYYSANTQFGLGSTIGPNQYVVYNGSGTTVNVTGLNPGSVYYIEIWSFNGNGVCVKYYTGALLTSNYITSTSCKVCPIITGIVIDACNGVCSEGDNEIVYMRSGSFPLPVNSTDFNFNYGQTNIALQDFTSSLTTNAATLSTLNNGSPSTCPSGTFIDALSVGTIPSNSNIMLIRNTFCPASYNLSNLCANGPFYVIFSSSPFWTAGGNFGNSGCGASAPSGTDRSFQLDFSGLCNKCLINYQYSCLSLNGSDGAFITPINPYTGLNVLYSNTASTSCNLTTLLLPIKLTSFEGQNIGDTNEIYFATEEEVNLQKFIMERSSDNTHFHPIGEITPKGEIHGSEYTFVDQHPLDGIGYYRLRTEDLNGETEYYNTIGIRYEKRENENIIVLQDASTITIIPDKVSLASNHPKQISLLDMSGKTIVQVIKNDNSPTVCHKNSLAPGIYIIHLTCGTLSRVKKISVQ